MSDPIDRLLDAAESGKSIIKNRDILHYSHIPNTILHRDSEQELVAQSLLPILKHSTLSWILEITFLTTNVLPIPGFPYTKRLDGLDCFRIGNNDWVTFSSSEVLCWMVSGT